MEWERDHHPAGGQVFFFFALDYALLSPSCNRKQDVLSTHEDYQAQFYKDYRKMAEEYDREFLKKYDEDLSTTLIFVSFVLQSGECVLSRMSGGSILCRNFCFHRAGRFSATTRPG